MDVVILFSLVAFFFSSLAHTREICYGDLGCFTDELKCHKHRFPPRTPEAIDLHFYLYTRRNQYGRYELFHNDAENVRSSCFDPKKKTKVLTHGYLGFTNEEENIYLQIKDAFLDRNDYNFILMDWNEGSVDLYTRAMQNARVVARQTAILLRLLNLELGASYADVHVMGYSLGGHVAGYIGQEIPGLGRITALDPAGPGFQNTDIAECRLDETDALFVDVIHTDGRAGGYGTLTPLGHVDFYPNGGRNQEGCQADAVTICSHGRVLDLFLESLTNKECSFTSYPCSSWKRYRRGLCDSCGALGCPVMGIDADLTPMAAGSFYLATNGESPFCKST